MELWILFIDLVPMLRHPGLAIVVIPLCSRQLYNTNTNIVLSIKASLASEESKLFTWLLENLRLANNQEFVDLIEIKSKCNFRKSTSLIFSC
jgi:CRISPR/Cas system CMR-associated protein Cmr5 small subunit